MPACKVPSSTDTLKYNALFYFYCVMNDVDNTDYDGENSSKEEYFLKEGGFQDYMLFVSMLCICKFKLLVAAVVSLLYKHMPR